MFPGTIDTNVLNRIQNLLNDFNPYVKIYQQAGELLRNTPSLPLKIILKSNTTKDKTFNKPTSSEIAVLMINTEESDQISKRDVIVNKKNKEMFLNENISYYDHLAYSIMHINGEAGWQYSFYTKLNKKEIINKGILIRQELLINPPTEIEFGDINNDDLNHIEIIKLNSLQQENFTHTDFKTELVNII